MLISRSDWCCHHSYHDLDIPASLKRSAPMAAWISTASSEPAEQIPQSPAAPSNPYSSDIHNLNEPYIMPIFSKTSQFQANPKHVRQYGSNLLICNSQRDKRIETLSGPFGECPPKLRTFWTGDCQWLPAGNINKDPHVLTQNWQVFMGQKGHWPICLCITSILGKPPFEVGGSNRIKFKSTRRVFATTIQCFLDMQKNDAESVEEKTLVEFRHTEKGTNLTSVAVLWGIILQGALWRWMLQDIIHLKNWGKSLESGDVKSKQSVLWTTSYSTVSNHFQSKSPLCVQTPSYSLDPVAMWLHFRTPRTKRLRFPFKNHVSEHGSELTKNKSMLWIWFSMQNWPCRPCLTFSRVLCLDLGRSLLHQREWEVHIFHAWCLQFWHVSQGYTGCAKENVNI